MKHLLLTAALAAGVAATAPAQHAPVPDVEILPLPEGVVSVAPAQGFIEVSPNVFPLGAQEITVTFPEVPVINTECTAVAQCYFDGAETPVAEVTVASAYVDAMGYPTSSVNFGKKLTAPGTYHVVIPAGFWTVSGNLTPEIQLNYEIFDLYRLSPAAGIQSSISELVVDFPKADEVKVNSVASLEFYRPSPEYLYGIKYDIVANDKDGRMNRVVLTFNAEGSDTPVDNITTPGSYTFHAVADAFSAIVYGPDHATDPTDYAEWKTPEILRFYEIAAFPAPEISPAQGEVKEFSVFTLSIPEGFELMMVDNMSSASAIYAVNPDGSLATDPICKLKAQRDFDVPGEFTLHVADLRGVILNRPIVPEPGDYMVVLGTALFSGMYHNQFINSAPFQYLYTVVGEEDAVETISGAAAPESYTVYNFAGVRVLTSGDAAALRALPKGLYIVNGKKMVIR